jgi:molybdate transport system substrate-binding protein
MQHRFNVCRLLIAAVVTMFAAIGCTKEPQPTAGTEKPAAAVRVFAAASLTDAMADIAAAYEKQSGVPVTVSADSTSTLAKQIEQGAPCDLFISANAQWMDYVDEKSRIRKGTRVDLLGNILVLVAPRGERFDARFEREFDFAAALGEGGRLALGDPAHVPAGQYAREALQALGWWERVEPKVIPAADVRAALRLVERGEAAAGIVYGSDARAADVEVIGEIPSHLHAPITYPAALTVEAEKPAEALLEFLSSAEAAAIFRTHGFAVIEPR